MKKKHILFGIFGKTPFLCKVSLVTRTSFFSAVFASPNAPYFENWVCTPVSTSYSSASGNLNKYSDDTFAITGSDSILFVSRGFVLLIMLKVFHRKEFCEISGIQQKFQIVSFLCVHVQSHIFKTIWLIHKRFLHRLPKVVDILNQK